MCIKVHVHIGHCVIVYHIPALGCYFYNEPKRFSSFHNLIIIINNNNVVNAQL